MKYGAALLILIVSALVSSCGSSGKRAPILEGRDGGSGGAADVRTDKSSDKDWRPDVYVVEKGDTLYSIAFNYGFDYHELAELNHIEDPSLISIGQQIRLFPGRGSRGDAAVPVELKPIEVLIKEQPKLVKYAYSPAAMAQIEKVQQQKFAPSTTEIAEVASVPPKRAPEPQVATAATKDAADENVSALAWMMPARGKVIGGFSEIANRKGIDIAGTLGEPIFASEAGKVVYSGSGLRGYGKLIIIKHNKTYLSAYAHNDKVLVKEGDNVTRGQKIAAMGRTDSDKVKLHFEVRRFGRPVDPARFLPLDNS